VSKKTGNTITTEEEHPIHHEERHVEWRTWRQNSKITIKMWN